MAARRGRGDLGQQILAILATSDSPLTPAQVHEALGDDLAYTTVMTVMARLAEKGVLARHREGRAFAYTPLQDPARVTARRMHKILAVEPDRAGALARFVDDLSAEDEVMLRRLFADTADGSDAS